MMAFTAPRRPWPAAVGLLAFAVLTHLPAPAAAEPVPGAWIRVPGTITQADVLSIQHQTEQALKKDRAARIVYHFQAGDLSSYGACLDLADFLVNKINGRAEVYAYLNRPVRGHAVLPVLACQSIFMGPEAALGFDKEAYDRARDGQDRDPPFDPNQVQKYLQVAEARGSKPAALIVKMLDKDLTLYNFADNNGRHFKLDPDEVRNRRLPLAEGLLLTGADRNTNPRVYLAQGMYGYYSADQALEAGLASGRKFDSPQKVIELLQLAGSVLSNTRLLTVDTPRALWIDLGEENRGTAALSGLTATLRRKIPHAIEREKASCVVFRIQGAAGPGAANAADDLAKFIQELGKDYEVLTVAYVPGRAAGAYLYPVLACSQIVLGPEARLEGDPLIFQDAARPFPESEVRRFQESLPQLAEVQGYNPVLVRGLVDRKLEIWRLAAPADPRRPGAPPEVTFVAGADVAGLLDRGWRKVDDKPIKRGNPPGLLSLTADQALDWGLAYRKVEIDAEASVLAAYGIDSRNVLRLRADWLDGLVSVLVHPVCTVFLVIVAFTCLILEFKAPGMVVPAVVAAVCFVLLFWAHTRLSGEVNALAILLFLLGLVLLGIELLIIPGFGFTGIAGILLVLLGLALLVVQQWPTTRDEYTALGTNIGMFAGSMVAAIFAAYTVARYLPHIPYANKLVLTPPEETAEEEAAALAQPAGMLGAIGVAITTLRPAGKARFGDQFIDVVAEGYYVETGQRVQIIEIDGMRVVVKPV